MSPGIWIAIGVAVVVILFVVVMYNRLVSLRERVRMAWAQIDVLLKRRHDLIPNLVNTVKGYAAHESKTLEAVIAARNTALGAGVATEDRIQAEGALTGALRRLMVVAEAYPELRANANFSQLQAELADSEDQISHHRQAYNDLVATYNTATMSFPANLVAGVFGFRPQPFFEVQDVTERDVPKVEF
jgi:LemA protein